MDKSMKRAYEPTHIRPALRDLSAASDLWAKGLAKAKSGGITPRMLPGDLSVAINHAARALEQWFSAWVNEQAGQRGAAETRSWHPALQRFSAQHAKAADLYQKIRAVIGLSDGAAIVALQQQMGIKTGLEDASRFTDLLPKNGALARRADAIPIVKAARELNLALFSSGARFRDSTEVVKEVTATARSACLR